MQSKRAIVIGAGMSGLLAARVAAEHFEQVTVLEKDTLPGPEARKGVPQGKHIHVLWTAGAKLLEQYFPGLFDDLAAAGGESFDNSSDMRWYHGGVWKMREPAGMRIHSQSRPLLEHHVRRILLQRESVRIRRGSVNGLIMDQGAVRGVSIRPSEGADKDLAADLVIDASGRGSRLPAWLQAHGLPAPAVEEVDVDLRYATRLYERADGMDWKCMAVYGRPPDGTRAGVIFPIENNRWIVTLAGSFGDHPGGDDTGFLDFARALDRPDLYEAIAKATAASDIACFSYPKEIWRRYDRLGQMPGGLTVIGDAMCSFNPLYGQGVTVAALEAAQLDQCLRKGDSLRSYLRAARNVIRYPWMLATGNDTLYPGGARQRDWWAPALGAYTDRILRLSASHQQAHESLLRVLHLARTPFHLFRPATLAAALFSRQARAPRT
jgi:2-polyprenyl-6-methoxyphenol hydroxylase-like FAD-dependent oxidoreductase